MRYVVLVGELPVPAVERYHACTDGGIEQHVGHRRNRLDLGIAGIQSAGLRRGRQPPDAKGIARWLDAWRGNRPRCKAGPGRDDECVGGFGDIENTE